MEVNSPGAAEVIAIGSSGGERRIVIIKQTSPNDKLLYIQNIKLEGQSPHCATKWMWIGINSLGMILRIDGLTCEPRFARNGAHAIHVHPTPYISR
jgi:hypothetical protein